MMLMSSYAFGEISAFSPSVEQIRKDIIQTNESNQRKTQLNEKDTSRVWFYGNLIVKGEILIGKTLTSVKGQLDIFNQLTEA